jgi:hypothetical protein
MVMEENKDGALDAEKEITAQPQPAQQPASVPEPAEQDVFEAASHATDEPDASQYMPQLRPKKKWPKIVFWTILGLVILAAIAAGGYFLAKHKSAKLTPTNSQTQSSTSGTKTNTGSQPSDQNQASQTASSTQYTSTNLKLSFSYPSNWTVVDAGGGKLTVTSPSTQLTDASGQSQTGQVILQIENQNSADMSAFKTGSATAVIPSQKVAYSNPTSSQRAQTYLSFLQYAATTTHGALDAVYITGDLGYQKGQTAPESDVAKIDPLVRVIFVKCADSKCSSTAPISISSDSWGSSSYSGPVTDMIKSLAFQ